MKGLPFVLLFTAMTFVAWGAYGPVLHHGALALEHDSMRAFVGVGLAYFMIAVIIPVLILRKGGETGRWTMVGAIYSLVAGAVGAVGALGIILALGYGGQTVYVMPLVFGFAPVVNTLVTAMLSRTFNQIRPIFIIGIVTAALGAGGVLAFKPAPKPLSTVPAVTESSDSPEQSATEPTENGPLPTSEPTSSTSTPSTTQSTAAEATNGTPTEPSSDLPPAETKGEATTGAPATSDPAASEPATGEPATGNSDASDASDNTPPDDTQDGSPTTSGVLSNGSERFVMKRISFVAPMAAPDATEETMSATPAVAKPRTVNVPGVVISIIVAALCWGSYGPMLHIGQSKMSGSRLRPFTCVGLAYFFIAVAAPLGVIYSRANDTGAWTAGGMTWSFLAGIAGAIGALGVILAFNAGGKPYYVMPLIFGFAPVINTFISLSEAGTWTQVSLAFWISLAVVIAGAVIVLTNAPRPRPHPAK